MAGGGKGASNNADFAPNIMASGEKGTAIQTGQGLGAVGKESDAGGGDQWNTVLAAKNRATTSGGGEQAGTAAATGAAVGQGTSYETQRQGQAVSDTLSKYQDYFGDLSKGSNYQQSPWASFLPNLLSGAAKGAMGDLKKIGGGGGSAGAYTDPGSVMPSGVDPSDPNNPLYFGNGYGGGGPNLNT